MCQIGNTLCDGLPGITVTFRAFFKMCALNMADQLNFKAKITSRHVTLRWMVPQKVTLPKITAIQLMQND